jgi:hypothetical protein
MHKLADTLSFKVRVIIRLETIYYILRYGFKGAERKVKDELHDLEIRSTLLSECCMVLQRSSKKLGRRNSE